MYKSWILANNLQNHFIALKLIFSLFCYSKASYNIVRRVSSVANADHCNQRFNIRLVFVIEMRINAVSCYWCQIVLIPAPAWAYFIWVWGMGYGIWDMGMAKTIIFRIVHHIRPFFFFCSHICYFSLCSIFFSSSQSSFFSMSKTIIHFILSANIFSFSRYIFCYVLFMFCFYFSLECNSCFSSFFVLHCHLFIRQTSFFLNSITGINFYTTHKTYVDDDGLEIL